MKRIALVLALIVAIVVPALAHMETVTINLPTLQCGMCKKTIESKLKDFKGLESITVNVEEKTATVVYNPHVTTLPQIEEAISKAGYDANETKADVDAQKKLHACCRPGAHE